MIDLTEGQLSKAARLQSEVSIYQKLISEGSATSEVYASLKDLHQQLHRIYGALEKDLLQKSEVTSEQKFSLEQPPEVTFEMANNRGVWGIWADFPRGEDIRITSVFDINKHTIELGQNFVYDFSTLKLYCSDYRANTMTEIPINQVELQYFMLSKAIPILFEDELLKDTYLSHYMGRTGRPSPGKSIDNATTVSIVDWIEMLHFLNKSLLTPSQDDTSDNDDTSDHDGDTEHDDTSSAALAEDQYVLIDEYDSSSSQYSATFLNNLARQNSLIKKRVSPTGVADSECLWEMDLSTSPSK
ncbi:MAG: hypothetical protein P1U74_02135 [Legionellaceae bacterium]|nr:hypothetical protein [Legionellaceae bacterium]